MIRLFLLCCLLSTYAYAVSNPEISTKSGKSQQASSSNQKQVVAQHDDPLLNSINAYAQQYESSSTPSKSSYGLTTQLYSQPYVLSQQPQYSPQTSYRPQASSPHLPSSPALETNFQPMPPAPQHQHHHHHQPHIQAPQQSPPTPVLMQYLPQNQINDGGVQYLQLIPTRPLIVPISPYMSPMAQQAYHAPQIIPQPPPHQLNDYVVGRSQNEPDAASNIPYGMQAYANSLENYRSYRFNREIKPINGAVGMILNMQEYMPSPNDAPKSHSIRGRP